MFKGQTRVQIEKAINSLVDKSNLSSNALLGLNSMSVQRSKGKGQGDYACNIAMLICKQEKKAPVDIANMIAKELEYSNMFDKVEVAFPGFINLTLSDQILSLLIPHIFAQKDNYGKTTHDNPKRVLIEFVSANPTGGLHLGHARGAFVGDAVARLMRAAGFLVTKEYYVNDAGNQIETLGRTIYKRYQELFGQKISIEPGEYPGEYVIDIAKDLKSKDCDKWLNQKEDAWLSYFSEFGVQYNLNQIKESLLKIDIDFDNWFYESKLHKDKKLDELIKIYQAKNMLYDADNAHGAEDKIRRQDSKASKYTHKQEGGLFIKTSQFGDDEDRIIKRKDESFVYLTADLAYHHQKYTRGFDKIINVFGADHAGHIKRIKAGMLALEHDIEKLNFVVVQMVRLIKHQKEVKFSKRAGEVESIDDLIDEIGKDAARFVFLMRSANSQFDLDLDLVTKKSNDNPVFYVQYGHARMATILLKAQEDHGLAPNKNFSLLEQALLVLPEERELLLRISELDEVVYDSAQTLEPHKMIYFCQELVKIFHTYFTKYRSTEKIISDNIEKTTARLSLVFAVKQSIANALGFLGLLAPEHMSQPQDDEG